MARKSIKVEADIFKADRSTISPQKLIFTLWKNRENDGAVVDLATKLSKFVQEKTVLSEVEFYLPQLSHMIIHLDAVSGSKSTQALEYLAIALAQTSMHTALQLNFIILAAMEDYQPETTRGMPNPNANPDRYLRCARILQNIERAVVYGTVVLTGEEEHTLASRANLTKDKITELYDHERYERAKRLSPIVNSSQKLSSTKSGILMFKRLERKSSTSRKVWKRRYFTVHQRVLFCYKNDQSNVPLRSLPLADCIVEQADSAKYSYSFSVICRSTGARFQLRAVDQTSYQEWMAFFQKESPRAPDPLDIDPHPAVLDAASGVSLTKLLEKSGSGEVMTAAQLKRFKFFQQQKLFVTNMTDICERLRFLERDVRKFFLRRDVGDMIIPFFSYLPLCNSTDTYRCILRALPKDGHAFTTKARCPALMLFEMEEHPEGLDVAAFLGGELHEYDQSDIIVPTMTSSQTDLVLDRGGDDDSMPGAAESLPSRFDDVKSNHRARTAFWKEEGYGMRTIGQPGDAGPQLPPPPPARKGAGAGSSEEKDPPRSAAIESFAAKEARIRATSPYGGLPTWRLDGLIAKSNDDVRQEVFVMQMIKFLQLTFAAEKIPVFLHTYKILSTTQSTGLIQLIPNATSIDGLKKSKDFPGSLRAYFEKTYGPAESAGFKAAVGEFVKSMAAYSIVSYLLAIKDRHNGNVMIDLKGRFIHIDFGFVFGLAPGKQFSMETAPFKLTEEWAQVMGGRFSADFAEYARLCTRCMLAARKQAIPMLTLMEIMFDQSNYPAFRYNPHAISDFRARLMVDLPEAAIEGEVNKLISRSYRHSGTDLYDSFQKATNGIAK